VHSLDPLYCVENKEIKLMVAVSFLAVQCVCVCACVCTHMYMCFNFDINVQNI
jgi:hypothetical protein